MSEQKALMHEWQEEIERKYESIPGKRYWHYKSPVGVYYQSFVGPERAWKTFECLGLWGLTIRGQWILIQEAP